MKSRKDCLDWVCEKTKADDLELILRRNWKTILNRYFEKTTVAELKGRKGIIAIIAREIHLAFWDGSKIRHFDRDNQIETDGYLRPTRRVLFLDESKIEQVKEEIKNSF